MKRWMFGLLLVGLLGALWTVRAAGESDIFAEAEIARLPVTYAWAVDALDIDTLMTIFSDDVEYDLSAYGIPNAKGKAAIRNLFLSAIFPINRCSLIVISNIWSKVTGVSATGGDYFVHAGYNPVAYPANTRRHTEGRHFYRFKKVRGEWKVSYLRGEPFFQTAEPFDPVGLLQCPMASGK